MQCLSARSSKVSASHVDLANSKVSGFQSPNPMKKPLQRQPIEKFKPPKEAAKKLGTKTVKRKIGKIPSTKLNHPPGVKSCFNLSELFCVQAKRQDKRQGGNLAEMYDAYLSDPTLEDQKGM